MPLMGADFGQEIELRNPAAPASLRILFVAVGTLFAAIGIYALGKTLVAAVTLATGGTLEGRLVYGFLIGVPFTAFGALAIWVFLRPDMRLCFDGTARQAVLVRRYPFGIVRRQVFDLEGLTAPEVVWQRNSDRTEGGGWELRLDLPGQRAFCHLPGKGSAAQQRVEAEHLRDAIVRLLG